MHDHFRDLGRQLEKSGEVDMREALPCKLRKRLWESTQDLIKVQQDSCDILSEWVVHNMELSV